MVVSSKGTYFHIEPAAENDWPWIIQGSVESIWESLRSEHRQGVNRKIIREHLNHQIARIRGPNGFPNQVFIARNEKGREIGFIWVAEIRSEFTGQLQAFILDVFVAEPYRGQGLGRCLMETAEEWARQRGLQRITLSVAEHNLPALKLYKALGYQVETLRMSKLL